MNIATVISNEVKNLFRMVKSYTIGKNIVTAKYVASGCIDFNPVKNMKPIYAKTGNNSEPIVIGYMLKSAIDDLNTGEGAFYSVNDSEVPQAIVKARKNGNLEVNGDSDFMVRYSKLEEAYNQLKSDLDSLVSSYNSHVHPGVTSGGSSTAPTPTQGSPSTGNITGAKIDNVLTN